MTENELDVSADDSQFSHVRARLEEIVEEVNADGVSLDDALGLYDEAVKLALQACDLSEEDLDEKLPNP